MIISSLKLTNFRNFSSFELKPDQITILVGPNGVGKTNVIESIYLLSVCRSYRSRRDAEVIRWNEDVARVSADLISDGGDNLKIALAQDGDKKIAFIGEKIIPVSLVVGKLPVVLFAPEEMDLPAASPAKRRRHLDILLSELDNHYLQTLSKYQQIVKARNKLLEAIAMKRSREDELKFWDKELVTHGTKILTERMKIESEINKLLSGKYGVLNDGNHKDSRILKYQYLPTVENIERFNELLVAKRDQDLRYRSTTYGPHRDDWQLMLDDVEVRIAASRGETRATLLALKMAEMAILERRRGEKPVLLLDDVFAELDRHHSDALLDFTRDNQVLITATDAEYVPESIRAKAKIIKLD